MSARWFRYYDEALDDPKVQRLPGELFKAWVNLLCLASRNEGVLPPASDIAFSLRVDEQAVSETLQALASAGLLDRERGTFRPHNWRGRQFKSDGSTERVKRFRERSKPEIGNVSPTATETGHATGPEQNRAESDTETETEQKEVEGKGIARQAVVSPRDPVSAAPDNPLAYYSEGEIAVLALDHGEDTEDRIRELWRWAESKTADVNEIKRMISGRMAKDAKARREAPALREQMENPPTVLVSSALANSRLAKKQAWPELPTALDRRIA